MVFTSNCTAVEAVCVTGAASRVLVPIVSKERVPVASRFGAVFAFMEGSYLSNTCIEVHS